MKLTFRLKFYVTLAVFAAVFAASAYAAEDFPYQAIINDDSVYIYSGPGSTHYTTDVFQRGDSVEVYQHLPGGWCAIRPPAGSFSWVPRAYVQPLGDGLAKIVSDDVASRIGSKLFPSQRSRTTVTLGSGKIVEILDMSADLGSWCKISPPSGEFRWVQTSFLSPPEMVVHTPRMSATAAETPAAAVSAGNPAAMRNFMWHVTVLETDLSRTIANNETSRWDTPSLLMRANSLENRAETVTQKEQVEMVRLRILEADEVRRKKLAMMEIEANSLGTQASRLQAADITPASGWRNTNTARELPPSAAPFTTVPGRHDYEGTLVLVRPREKKDFDLPRYALLDDRGMLRCYVTPPPDMDLAPYVDARVQIAGTQKYKPEHAAWNLTAREIWEMSVAGR